MAKNPIRKSKPVKRDDPMNGAMKFFLAGLVAELYLLIIRRFYVNGTAVQMIAWFDYLFYFSIAGLVILAAGAVLSAVWRADQKKRVVGWYVAAGGAFLAAASFLIWKLNTPALTFLTVLVAMAMLLGILWSLYDRECAYALTILGISLVALWGCRRELSNLYLGTYVKVAVVVYILLLALAAFLTRKASRSGGMVGKLQMLPADADTMPIYVACALSAAAMACALVSISVAYYAMWVLAMVVFALAVYYTVKQL